MAEWRRQPRLHRAHRHHRRAEAEESSGTDAADGRRLALSGSDQGGRRVRVFAESQELILPGPAREGRPTAPPGTPFKPEPARDILYRGRLSAHHPPAPRRRGTVRLVPPAERGLPRPAGTGGGGGRLSPPPPPRKTPPPPGPPP